MGNINEHIWHAPADCPQCKALAEQAAELAALKARRCAGCRGWELDGDTIFPWSEGRCRGMLYEGMDVTVDGAYTGFVIETRHSFCCADWAAKGVE